MSFQVASLAQVLSNGVPILNLAIEDGSSFTCDRANVIRRTCSLALTDPNETLVAATANQVLSPTTGNEIALYYGVKFDDGTTELIAVGIYMIEDTLIDDTGADLAITVTGSDRARWVQRDNFTDVYPIPPSTNVGLAIQSIILSRNVSTLVQQFNFAPTTATTPTVPIVYNAGDDPWQSCVDLATSIGAELFYDPNGICTLIPVPDPTLQPIAWTYAEGNSNIATEISRELNASSVFNVVIRDGTSTGGTPFRGEAQDTNPLSPTWVGGTYATVVDWQSSTLYANQAQAQVAANAALLTSLGSVETITISAIPKPDSDIDDVLSVTRVRAGIPSSTLYVTDSFSMGIGPSGVHSMTCRAIGGVL